jgi:hypothetical protein
MARIRTVKPEFWTDSKIVALTPLARLVYIGMWNFADDSGVIEDDPLEIKLRVAPTDDIDMAAVITELVISGRVKRATAPDGTRVLVIPRFNEHQRINRPSNPRHGDPDKFKYSPKPPKDSSTTHAPLSEPSGVKGGENPSESRVHGALTEPHMHARARYPEGKGREGITPPTPPGDDEPSQSTTAPGGSAAPKTETIATRVLDRVVGDAPPDVHKRLKAGLNGHHHTATQQALANGWQPGTLVAAISGRWHGVHDPPKALLARLRGIGPAPPDTTPPVFDGAAHRAKLEAEASDPETTAAQVAAIRRQLTPTEQDTP